MRFVVDESSVRFAGVAPQDDLERFEQLLDRIDEVLDHKYKITFSADLFTNAVFNEQTIYDLYVVSPQLHIPREVQERIAVIFGRLPKWDDVDSDLPSEFDVAIDHSQPIWAPSIA